MQEVMLYIIRQIIPFGSIRRWTRSIFDVVTVSWVSINIHYNFSFQVYVQFIIPYFHLQLGHFPWQTTSFLFALKLGSILDRRKQDLQIFRISIIQMLSSIYIWFEIFQHYWIGQCNTQSLLICGRILPKGLCSWYLCYNLIIHRSKNNEIVDSVFHARQLT